MKIGVMLSGCGVQDGSEVYEAVLTILATERAGAEVVALAPDIEQAMVHNHYTGAESRGESRSVLAEAARIVRGQIRAAGEVTPSDLDGLIIVGGFGAVRNLCSFAVDGIEAVVDPEVARLVQGMHELKKPIGAVCAAPIPLALALRERSAAPLRLTIGNDSGIASSLGRLGVQHQDCTVQEMCVDEENRVVSTPAFFLAQSPLQAEPGISALVNQVVEWAGAWKQAA